MTKVAVYIGNRYGSANPSDMDNRNTWEETDSEVRNNEVIKGVAFRSSEVSPSEVAPVIFVENVNSLVGELLMLNDATFADLDQRKAHKDLMTKTIWNWYHTQAPRMTGADASTMPSWDRSEGSTNADKR